MGAYAALSACQSPDGFPLPREARLGGKFLSAVRHMGATGVEYSPTRWLFS